MNSDVTIACRLALVSCMECWHGGHIMVALARVGPWALAQGAVSKWHFDHLLWKCPISRFIDILSVRAFNKNRTPKTSFLRSLKKLALFHRNSCVSRSLRESSQKIRTRTHPCSMLRHLLHHHEWCYYNVFFSSQWRKLWCYSTCFDHHEWWCYCNTFLSSQGRGNLYSSWLLSPSLLLHLLDRSNLTRLGGSRRRCWLLFHLSQKGWPGWGRNVWWLPLYYNRWQRHLSYSDAKDWF